MTAPKSPHIPEVAGAIATVTGTLLVDTGLREIQSFSVSLAQATGTATAVVTAVVQAVAAGQTAKLLLQAWEDDTTTASSAAAQVAWLAIGL